MNLLKSTVLVAALAVTGCGGSGDAAKAPEGQVIAEVGGEEVTMRELAAELANANVSDPEAAKAAERAALDAIINRKLLASAGREEGLDKGAEFQLARHRSEELLLAQAMQRKITSSSPRPSREEAERYMAEALDNFAQRKIYTVDQIQFSTGADKNKINDFTSFTTLDQIEQKLLSDGTEYKRVPASIDTAKVPPNVASRVAKIASGGVFIIPAGQMVTANRIQEARLVPFTGEAAISQAQQMLFRDRAADILSKQVADLRKKAGTVNYKKGYGVPPADAQRPTVAPLPAGSNADSDAAR